MKLYTPLIILLVLCLLITGCTFKIPTESTARPGGDDESESNGTKKQGWTQDIPLTGEWTASRKLSEGELVPLTNA